MAERRHRRRRIDDQTDAGRIRQLEDEQSELFDDVDRLMERHEALMALVKDRPTRDELRADYVPRSEHRAGTAERRDWTQLALQVAMWLTTIAAILAHHR